MCSVRKIPAFLNEFLLQVDSLQEPMKRTIQCCSVLFACVCIALVGCNSILGISSFTVQGDAGTTRDGGGPDSGCLDPTGFGGKGCYRCEPQTPEQLLSACTSAAFEPFDNAARIPNFDPERPLPTLPLIDAGSPDSSVASDSGGPVNDRSLPLCTFAEGRNPVLVVGSTGYPYDVISRAMGGEATIYFREVSSCAAIDSVVSNGTKFVGAVKYFSPEDGKAKECFVPGDSAHPADLAPSALFPETCKTKLPNDVSDFLGPANPVVFVAPKISSTPKQSAISAEAAYRVYGFAGAQEPVEPWLDASYIFRRTASSGNQNAIAQTLGLPADRFRGTDSGGSSKMKIAIESSTNPSATIGISSSEIVDTLEGRSSLRTMAYQHFGQPVAFFPDSNLTAYDKNNVRDGHYYIWISLHVYARTTQGGDIVGASQNNELPGRNDAAVKNLVLAMTNRKEYPNPIADVFSAQKIAGLVPQCAMRVTRDKEGGPLRPFKPGLSCECAFDLANPSGAVRPECKACTDNASCSEDRPRCSFGYCEK
jgi:hypothetical protein